MNRCFTCKHWDRLDADGEGIGNCKLAQNENGWAGPQGKKTLAFATGEHPHGKWANLRCEPDFGCVQWESARVAKFEKSTVEEKPAIACADCGKTKCHKWFRGGHWYCMTCIEKVIPLPKCERCGAQTTGYGVEQYATASMGTDAYSFQQALDAVCQHQHVTIMGVQWGPGADEPGKTER